MTSIPHSKGHFSKDPFTIDLDDLDDNGSYNRSSFPSIHFEGSMSSKEDEDSESDSAFMNSFGPRRIGDDPPFTPSAISRTLYIQMVNTH
jgi:hypothetical protein